MKKFNYIAAIFSALLMLTACSDKGDDENVDAADEVIEDNEEDAEVEEDEEVEDETDVSGDIDFTSLLKEVEKATQGETNVIYEHDEQQVHEEDEYSVSLDGYVIAEINDFHMDYSIPFNSEEEGAVLLAHFTVENKIDEDIAYTPLWDLRYSGADRYPGPNRNIIPQDVQIASFLNSENEYVLKANDTVSGYYAIALRTVDLENIEKVNKATIEVPEAGDVYEPDNYSYKNKIGKRGEFSIVVNDSSHKKQQDDEQFYHDRTDVDNMGDKTMIKEKSDIGETKSLGNSEITLEGYQFTEFEPNEHEAPRFENFDTGIVLVNIKLMIENGEDEDLDLTGQKAKLTMNDGKQYTLHELMLSPYKYDDVIEAGSTEESIIVFALDKEQYEKIWKDKPFELEYGPLRGIDTYDLTKGKSVEFNLPK